MLISGVLDTGCRFEVDRQRSAKAAGREGDGCYKREIGQKNTNRYFLSLFLKLF